MSDIGISWELSVVKDATGSVALRYGKSFVVCSIQGPRPFQKAIVSSSSSSSSSSFSSSFSPSTSTIDSYGTKEACVISCSVKYASHLISMNYSDEISNHHQHPVFVKNAMESIISTETYPRSLININLLVLESSNDDLPALILASSLALMDSAIEIFDIVTCVRLSPLLSKEDRRVDKNREIVVAYSSTLEEISQYKVIGKLEPTEILELTTAACIKCQEIKLLVEKQLLLSSVTNR